MSQLESLVESREHAWLCPLKHWLASLLAGYWSYDRPLQHEALEVLVLVVVVVVLPSPHREGGDRCKDLLHWMSPSPVG